MLLFGTCAWVAILLGQMFSDLFATQIVSAVLLLFLLANKKYESTPACVAEAVSHRWVSNEDAFA